MRLISVNMLQIGETLACNIFSGNGNMLLKQNTELTDKMITRLKSVGIFSVYVEDERFDDVRIRFPLTDKSKSEALMQLKEIIQKLKSGRAFRHDPVRKLANEIYQEVRVAAIEPINIVSTFDSSDALTSHGLNVAIVTAALCEKLSIPPQTAANYVNAAMLHDAFLAETEDDFDDDNVHAQKLYNSLKATSSYDTACYLPASLHHEQYDGSGPRAMKGKQIHEGARIIAVADLFDNVLTGIAGYDSLLPYQAMEYVVAQANTLLDPDVVAALSRALAIYPNGSTVGLNTGQDAIVLRQTNGQPARPVIRLLDNSAERGSEIDLMAHHTLFISRSTL